MTCPTVLGLSCIASAITLCIAVLLASSLPAVALTYLRGDDIRPLVTTADGTLRPMLRYVALALLALLAFVLIVPFVLTLAGL